MHLLSDLMKGKCVQKVQLKIGESGINCSELEVIRLLISFADYSAVADWISTILTHMMWP